VFPLRDLSPSRGIAIATIALVLVNVVAFFAWQPHATADAEAEFLYRRAAIACEVIERTPISARDLAAGACSPGASGARGSEAIFPEKGIALSIIVSLFLHGGLLHLLGNMWFLWLFGDNVEAAFGHLGYLLLYAVAGIGGTLAFSALHPTSIEPMIGASGAIAGVLGAYIVLFPKGWVLTLWVLGILPVPSVVFLGLWFIGQFSIGTGSVAWEAHVAGFVIGAIVSLLLRERLLSGRTRARRSPRAMGMD